MSFRTCSKIKSPAAGGFKIESSKASLKNGRKSPEGGEKMRSQWAKTRDIERALVLLTPDNELVLRVQLATGLRVGDAVALKTADLERSGRFTIREQKTGKTRRITIPTELRDACLRRAGTIYVFPHRYSGRRHRTTSAVYKDLRRASEIATRGKRRMSTHTARKWWAVDLFRKSGNDLKKVQRLMNHTDPAITMLYALADQIGKDGYL